MMPGGIGGIGGTSGRDKNVDKGVARDPKEMDRYYFRKSQAEGIYILYTVEAA